MLIWANCCDWRIQEERIRLLLELLAPPTWRLFGMTALILLGSVLDATNPLLFGHLIDAVSSGDRSRGNTAAVLALGAGTLIALLRFLSFYLLVGSSIQVMRKLTVKLGHEDSLELSSDDMRANRHFGPSWLRPARDGLFILDPAYDDNFRFVQFIATRDSGPIEHLWNGIQLWRKE